MKKLTSILLAATLTAGTILGGTISAAADEGQKVGITLFGSASYALLTLANNSKNVFEAYGTEGSVYDANFQVDKLVQDVENMITGGCQGVAVWLPADSMYPTVAEICEKNQIPFVLVDKIPTDEAIAEQIKSNPYFAGAVSPANAVYGEQIAQYAIDQGWTSCILSASSVGDPSDTPRLNAFREKFEAAGGTVEVEIHSDTTDRIQPDLEDALMANMDVDFVYGTGSDFGCGAVAALENLGLTDIKVLTSGLDTLAVQELADGQIELLSGDDWAAGVFAAVLLQNAIDGNTIKDADGNAAYVEDLMPFELTGEQKDLFQKAFIDNFFYTDDELSAMRVSENPDFNYDEFMEVCGSFSFENRVKALEEAGVVTADDLAAAGIS
jgi:ribose transport system substrate-binding protein